jgi:trehalose-6-phosphate synthase
MICLSTKSQNDELTSTFLLQVVLVQVAVPSRQDVEDYQNLRASVNETVGRINGHFGTVESMPIHFLHRSVPFDELCALYAVSDACLVTSTRDGMNLVSTRALVLASQEEVIADIGPMLAGLLRIHCKPAGS